MIQDPYEILGVSRDASMDEIKKQYRILSRKYHPDANLNNPNKEEVAEKFRQVQEAYQMIVEEREHGTSGASGQRRNTGGGYGGFGDYGGFNYENPESGGFGPSMNEPRMRAAVNYIKNGYFQEALNTLADIENHDGNWYYLHAVAQAGLGNNVGAREDAEQALHLEPDNVRFRQLYNQLNGNVEWYQDQGRGYGYEPCGSGSRNCAPWACCLGLVLCNCLCYPYGGVICC